MRGGSGFDTCSGDTGKYKMNDDAEGFGKCLDCPAGEQQGVVQVSCQDNAYGTGLSVCGMR